MDFDKSRPSQIAFDTLYPTAYSVLGWSERSLGSSYSYETTETYKFRLIKAWNDARRILSQGDAYGDIVISDINDRDVISSQRGNPWVVSGYNKPIWHSKKRGVFNGFAFGYLRSDGILDMRGYYKFGALQPYTQCIFLSHPHDYSTEIMLARGRAASSLQPRIKEEISGALFLYELPEIKELLKLVASAVFRYGRLKTVIGKHYDPEDPVQDLNGIMLPIAGLNLTWQLALKPLIGDFKSIIDLVDTIHDRYKKAQKGVERTPHHYQERMFELKELTQYQAQWQLCLSYGRMLSADFHAEAWLKIPGMKLDFVQFLRKVGGLNVSWETIWQSIPFSFLLDYVLTLGKSLALLDETRILPHITLEYLETTKLCSSNGRHFDDRLFHNFYVCEPTTKLNQNKLMSGWESTLYNRTPTWPYKGLVVPRLRMPNLKQAIIALSLSLAWNHSKNTTTV